MAIDPTVYAGPFFFGSMALENRWLKARPNDTTLDQGRYDRGDATANITLALGSVAVPIAYSFVDKHLEIGCGKAAKPLLAFAAGAAAVATLADRKARRARIARRRTPIQKFEPTEHIEQIERIEATERLAGASAAAAIGAAMLVASSTLSKKASLTRLWPRRRVDLGTGVVAWTVAIVGYDFLYYWNHRLQHTSRFMWAIHVPHHSSERYNLSVALRQAVLDPVGLFVPYGLLAYVGVRPNIVRLSRTINLVYQFWVHTEAIDKMGAFEGPMNTPSHHRVHHGVDRKYIDRNHGGIFIVFDRWFKTFTPEEEHPRYGITTPLETNNLGVIVGHEFRDIARDVAASNNWRDRLSFVFRGPGWAYQRHRDNNTVDLRAYT